MGCMQILNFKTYSDDDHDGFVKLVNDVHAEFGYDYDPVLDADLADPPAFYHRIWVARTRASVVGSVALTSAKDGVTTLKRMYLRPDFRGQGFGRNLLGMAIETAVREGWTQIVLDTGAHQQDAQRLYESAGFRIDRRDGTTIYYSKKLSR